VLALIHRGGMLPSLPLVAAIALLPRPHEVREIITSHCAAWPGWKPTGRTGQIWTVPKAVGGTIWCARRWDGTGQVLNAASADELAEYLEEASSR
jgi:hypothetical protein